MIVEEEGSKHGSLTTIFSVWNAMVGTGMLTIPWAYSNSGFILGVSKYSIKHNNMDDLSGNTSQLPYQFLHMLPCTCCRWPRSRLYRYSAEAVWTKGMGRRYGYLHSQSLHTDHPVLPAFGLEPLSDYSSLRWVR